MFLYIPDRGGVAVDLTMVAVAKETAVGPIHRWLSQWTTSESVECTRGVFQFPLQLGVSAGKPDLLRSSGSPSPNRELGLPPQQERVEEC